MDLNQISHLTAEQKDHYVKLERMFGTPGWLLLEQWAEKSAIEQKERAALATTWDQNRIAVGALSAYQQVAGLQEATEREFEALAEDQQSKTKDEEEQRSE